MSLDVPAPPIAAPSAGLRLWNRNFLLVWGGQSVSQLGNQAYAVAVTFWVLETTHSASLMGLLMALGTLPIVLLTPFGGTFADRHSRVHILIVCDLLCGVGMVALAGFLRLAPPLHWALAGLFAMTVLGGLVRAFFGPAVQSLLPDLVPRDRLTAANSLNQLANQLAQLLGQAVGGVLYQVFGALSLFFFDGLSFLVGAAGSAAVSVPPAPPRVRAEGFRQVAREFLAATGSGLRYVGGHRGLKSLLVVAGSLNFLLAPAFVLLPFYVHDLLHGNAAWYGYLMAAMSLGTIAGVALAGALNPHGARRGWSMVAALVLCPGLLGVLGLVHQRTLALAVILLAGASLGWVNTFIVTLLQVSTPAELRGRVLGLLATLSGGLAPLGMALGGWLGDLTGHNVALVLGGSSALSVVVALVFATPRHCREFLASEAPEGPLP